jgi:hypothetical protein
MAKFDLKFIDCVNDDQYIKAERQKTSYGTIHSDNEINVDIISIEICFEGLYSTIWLDKSTAIKFAKTLRTEINKITESEVKNG